MQKLDLLVLGAGWTATFLLPLLRKQKFAFAATTRDGRDVAGEKTIKWKLDLTHTQSAGSSFDEQFSSLPLAQCILITFPLTGRGQSEAVVQGYNRTHLKGEDTHFIQLGSTGIWQIPRSETWVTRHSAYNSDNPRAVAEKELLELGGCVLNLAGLWGGERDPRNWVSRVAKTKEDVKQKQSLHLVHGLDVARAVIAVCQHWSRGSGQRWMLTDGFVYDWWALLARWAAVRTEDEEGEDSPSESSIWVFELMRESGVAALPRPNESLGRCYDSREFWSAFELIPLKGGLESL